MPYPPFYLPDFPGLGDPIVVLEGIPSAEAIGTLASNISETLDGIPSEEVVNDLPISSLETLINLVGFDASDPVASLSGAVEGVPEGVAFNYVLRPLTASERFSSQVVNQNAAHTDSIALTYAENEYPLYQEFYLPEDYVRGVNAVPPLTGFQVLSSINAGYKDVATLDWIIETYEIGIGWTELANGTTIGSNLDGPEVWFTVYTDKPIQIAQGQVRNKFRLGLRGRERDSSFFKEPVPYDGKRIRIGIESYTAELVPGKPHHFVHNGEQVTAYLDPLKELVYLSNERGISALWLTCPNPLVTQTVSITEEDGTPIDFNGEQASLNFRILAGTAEQGTDFLGNSFRSLIVATDVNSATVGKESSYWLSKPNPSKFAVESMYFDISDGLNRETTVDQILVDPITPGVHFNLYYSSEGDPTTDNDVWDRKLWTRLPQAFVAKQKDTYKLIKPVTARYLKIEFTQLQPQHYSPGNFQKPIIYRKHPKWVLDYFLSRLKADHISEDEFIGRNLEIAYNAYELAFDYYLGDLDSAPDRLLTIEEETPEQSELINEVDTSVLNGVDTRFNQYKRSLANMSRHSYTPPDTTRLPDALREDDRNYLPALSTEVSSLDREKLINERSISAMYFFITCRHEYRLVTARFDNNKAYFAGVKEISFLRDKYTKAFDASLYIEGAGDSLNSKRNDFTIDDGIWSP